MAIDTAAKRFSMIGFGSPIPSMVTVPSGTIGAGPRADLLYLYSGIALGGVVEFGHLLFDVNVMSELEFYVSTRNDETS